jgi:hypothetical protein
MSRNACSGTVEYEGTVEWFNDPKAPMPKPYLSPFNEQAVRDVATFIRNFLSWI